jgi:hypothetical protein
MRRRAVLVSASARPSSKPRASAWIAAIALPLVVAAAWLYSATRICNLFVYGPAGAVQMVQFDCGTTYWLASNVCAGRGRAWSCDAFINSRDDYDSSDRTLREICFGAAHFPKLPIERFLSHAEVERNRLGFALYRIAPQEMYVPDTSAVAIAAPFWFWMLVSLIPLARFGWSRRRSVLWIETGRCARCGYDLRASSRRCPECGTEFARTETQG